MSAIFNINTTGPIDQFLEKLGNRYNSETKVISFDISKISQSKTKRVMLDLNRTDKPDLTVHFIDTNVGIKTLKSFENAHVVVCVKDTSDECFEEWKAIASTLNESCELSVFLSSTDNTCMSAEKVLVDIISDSFKIELNYNCPKCEKNNQEKLNEFKDSAIEMMKSMFGQDIDFESLEMPNIPGVSGGFGFKVKFGKDKKETEPVKQESNSSEPIEPVKVDQQELTNEIESKTTVDFRKQDQHEDLPDLVDDVQSEDVPHDHNQCDCNECLVARLNELQEKILKSIN